MKNTLLTTTILGCLSIATAQAATVLTEDFVAIDDWTFDVNSDGVGGNLTSTAVGGNTAIHEAGSSVDGNDNEGTLIRTISTVGYTDISIDFSVFQFAGGSYEGSESFDISVDTGSGYTSLSGGSILGRLSTGSAGTANASDVFTLSGESLGAAADNGSFDLKITINTGYWIGSGSGSAAREEYRLENLVVNGTAVPEPSSTALLGLAGLTLMLRRRK